MPMTSSSTASHIWQTESGTLGGAGSAEVLAARLLVQLEALWGAINQRSILLPAAFVFLWQVRPALPNLIEPGQGHFTALANANRRKPSVNAMLVMKGPHSKSRHAVCKMALFRADILSRTRAMPAADVFAIAVCAGVLCPGVALANAGGGACKGPPSRRARTKVMLSGRKAITARVS